MIPFNKPFIIGKELEYIQDAVSKGHLSGDGAYTKKCHKWMEQQYGAKKVLLTHSCTAALEMAAILSNLSTGDEVIMPSYTFVSTANAFVMRGATPVWCDIRADTLNIDENQIEALITPNTKAITVVHYAGVAAEMDTIMAIALKHNLLVIEDAAQGVNATYKGRYLGTIGHLGAYSFHETKNIITGEGGALLINDERFIKRSEVIREKGTNRCQFFRGEVDKYTWVDIGSSFLPSELVAAFLYAQLEDSKIITTQRKRIFQRYYEGLHSLERQGILRRPIIPDTCEHNAHMFYIILNEEPVRHHLIHHLKAHDIHSVFHYVPLHNSPAGKKYGKQACALPVTERYSERLLRLPCYYGLDSQSIDRVLKAVHLHLTSI
ncbi:MULTISPECIES: dTDP-4-amino-4,6-dideoxygalactose transaminase [unclassified Lentimonas]|uniref:dTDP-4-amino-4,6-dideoxygalactose transaminase n=1 Tax=unclassified Lentimonas TaxID=2630993 RepID=UPI001326D0DB|nr:MULTISPECIES: dTDP-4-amino-4,6-dideoxygalactose transaminase [unclassified Lentimonas]CAA6676545.1 Lipopolysaccharide biosynthesis protein RffA [Lentimonas sp. CC4]CAA6685385.1 Lipopolysaccharide biosynthesis protein RffA [Lentimonas sp. CC6]CAA7074891.1 Lipopolysaccharide biosynthesis protein RffA [Lentimonas sp. CC4]CAA7169516.1 Lipopolysaccharide biosynthesis protein RffA [Lentimonas sp. CC21]CAA7182723.1 Lipopolysaccharide biosynthesis protein RffA [Lentimonas sp. CC8]